MESLCSRGTTIGVKTVRTKTCLGLPSLNVPRGPRAQQKGSCSRVGPQLQRCWTLRSKGPSTTTVAALPLPFLEISVSVLDTLDLVRSSVEEEVSLPALINLSSPSPSLSVTTKQQQELPIDMTLCAVIAEKSSLPLVPQHEQPKLLLSHNHRTGMHAWLMFWPSRNFQPGTPRPPFTTTLADCIPGYNASASPPRHRMPHRGV